MKLLHTADWHIGQNFYGYERREEHQYFLDWLKATLREEAADVLLIAGDVFDSPNPSAESQRMFYAFLHDVAADNPSLQVVVTAGNHDSAARLEAPQDLLSSLRVEVRGLIRRRDDGQIDLDHLIVPLRQQGELKAWCLAVPYLRQGDYPESSQYGNGVAAMYEQLLNYLKGKNQDWLPLVAMGHLHVMGSELSDNDRSERVVVGGLEYVSADAFAPGLAYVALGHLHKPQRVGGNDRIRYSGSPLPMSFSEKYYKQGVNLIEISDAGAVDIRRIDFYPLCGLLSLPQKAQPLAEVIRELLLLPDGEVGPSSPYLEIKVLETEPEPSKRHQIEEAIKGKAVRLTRITAVTPQLQREQQNVSLEAWQNIEPREMAQKVFRQKYGAEMPSHLEGLLLNVIREVQE